ncbi:sensor histidine kinase [Chryseobacterium bernardetii]|uniref:Histidine kinase n=1 Tax=Chryseobacterium bernardetii TaxID=1241978 RepID=A0A3G6U7J6_9FLAO|nr:histidine kinase [Chryseobacterium bernardetii]AZB23887.1 histidine kinase [Chryseobacterium bernardetii]AZB34480.1 histidine kinase [Chryseobacterium bernardetii]
MKQRQLIFLHIFYWTMFLVGTIIVPYFVYDTQHIEFKFTYLLTSLICFYFNFFIIVPRFFDINKLYKTIVGFSISVTCFVVIRYFTDEVLLPYFGGVSNYPEGTNFGYYFFDNIYNSVTSIFISTVFCLFKIYSSLDAERLRLVEEKKNAELKALKTQINPHFIFNTLNNIYSLVYQKSEKALPAIEELGQLLRYSAKDLEGDFISLDKEIGYIDSLIELEKLRLRNPELILVEKNIEHPYLNISPMLLVPFVENAFKHGDLRGKGFELKVSDRDKVLHFYLLNFKKNKMKDPVSGIGIQNVKKRLEILYPKHDLNIKDSETEFVVDLKIDLRDE